MLAGSGFIITQEETDQLLRSLQSADTNPQTVIREYRNGRDLAQTPRGVEVIDLFGLDDSEARQKYPAIYQLILNSVKPDRDQNRRKKLKEQWWIFGEPRKTWRKASESLSRYIATVETTKHRIFQFLDSCILPDHMIIAIALDSATHLGVLSSRIHSAWALNAGGRLGIGNDPRYNKSLCLATYPFPAPSVGISETVANLAEQLDSHRKRQQKQHPGLTMTGMYTRLTSRAVGCSDTPSGIRSSRYSVASRKFSVVASIPRR